MKLHGDQPFEASRETVWETVLRPDVLEDSIPGAQTVERPSDGVYEGTVSHGMAGVSVKMEITVDVREDDRPDSMTVEINGSDNLTNTTVTGDVVIELEADDDVTLLSYEAELHFTGKLASLGGRLIKRQLNKDLGTFFENVNEHVVEASTQVES